MNRSSIKKPFVYAVGILIALFISVVTVASRGAPVSAYALPDQPIEVKLTVSAPDTTYSGTAKTITATYLDADDVERNAKATLVGNNVNAGDTFRYVFEIEDPNYKIAPGDIDLDRYSIVNGVAGTAVYTVNKATIPTCNLEQKEIPVYDGQVKYFTLDSLLEDVQGVAGDRDDFTVEFKLSGEDEAAYAEDRTDVMRGKDVGEYLFDCKVEMDNHETVYRQVAFSIAPRPVAVTYTSQRKEIFYGDEEGWNAFGAEMSGNDYYLTADNLADGDSLFDIVGVDIIGTKGSVLSLLGPTLDAGRYDLFATSAENTNYDVSIDIDPEAFLTVKKSPISIFLDVENTTYGTGLAAPIIGKGVIVTGWKGSDDASLIEGKNFSVSYAPVGDTRDRTEVESGSWTKEAPVSAGEYYVVATISGLCNYEDATGEKRFSIAKKKLFVIAEDRTVTYGEDAPEYTARHIGFAYEETVSDLDGELVFVCGYVRRDGVGTKPIVASGLTSANYEIEYIGGVLTVKAKPIDVIADNKTSVFGDALVPLTAQADLIEGDAAEDVYVLSSTVKNDSAAGVYAIVVAAVGNKNYLITAINGTYTINERKTILTNGKTRYFKEISSEEAASEEGVDVTVLFKNAAADPSGKKEVKVYAGDVGITFNASAIQIVSAQTENKIRVETDDENATMVVRLPNCKATVSMPFDGVVPSEKEIRVFRIDEKGKKTAVYSVFRDGVVTFDADGSARYIVTYALTARTIARVVAICVATGLVITLCVLLFLKIEKKNK